jgi:hypothetical protein
MTKQAMGELVSQCAALRLVVTGADPSDKRARRPVHARGTAMARGVSGRGRAGGTGDA